MGAADALVEKDFVSGFIWVSKFSSKGRGGGGEGRKEIDRETRKLEKEMIFSS